MPRVIARQVELDLNLEQVLGVVRQLPPQEQELVWRAIKPPMWSQRLGTLLTRIWTRVERYPITEEEIAAEVESARSEHYAQSCH